MPIDSPNSPAPEHIAAPLLAAHRPEVEFLTGIGGNPRIVDTGGIPMFAFVAIEAEAGPIIDPTGTLYVLITSIDAGLAYRRSDIDSWTVVIYDAAESHDEGSSAAENATSFTTAWQQAWAAIDRPDDPHT
ncbi:hypothetical protein [Nocardia asiatica]|uniref:hypothetical protein n=1 Tax=Nocardia asiatica TaxID=209252 RepID=UPI0003167F31|nr:hypothetical protein [Nocardia asiatica]